MLFDMDMQTIARKIAIEMQPKPHGYKSELTRFREICKSFHRSHGFLIEKDFNTFFDKVKSTDEIKKLLQTLTIKEPKEKPTTAQKIGNFLKPPSYRPITEGDGVLFTLAQISKFNLNPDTYL